MCAGKSFTTYTDANSCGCWVCETTVQEKWRRNASCFLRLSARNPATARWGALDCKRKLGIPGTRLAIRVSPNAALSQVKRLSALCSRLCRTGTTWNKQLRMQCTQDCIHLHCFQVLMKGCTLCAHLDSPLRILSFHQLYQVISCCILYTGNVLLACSEASTCPLVSNFWKAPLSIFPWCCCWRLPTNCHPPGSQCNFSGWIKLPNHLGCATDQIRATSSAPCLSLLQNRTHVWGIKTSGPNEETAVHFFILSWISSKWVFLLCAGIQFLIILTVLICLISSVFLISFDFQHHWIQWLLGCDTRKASRMLNQFALCLSARIVQSLQLTTSRQVHQSWDHSKEETRNKANRANLASFALPLWKKSSTGYKPSRMISGDIK